MDDLPPPEGGAANRRLSGGGAVTSLAVPRGSLDRWRTRLADAGCHTRDTDGRLGFQDLDGTDLELVETDAPAEYEAPGGDEDVRPAASSR